MSIIILFVSHHLDLAFFFFKYLFYVYLVFCLQVCLCESLDLLKLELQKVVVCHVGAVN